MKKNSILNTITRNRYFRYGVFIFIGVFLGWVFFGKGGVPHSHEGEEEHDHAAQAAQPTVWTCSMHPQIKQDKPGKCPICGMDLTPMRSSANSDEQVDMDAIQLSPEAMALANVETTVVSKDNPTKDISLYGTIQADERLVQSQTAHVSGRIEKLYINFTGESVSKGQVIARIYSPDLQNAQQELLEAQKLVGLQPDLLEAAREKLRLWKLSDNQIAQIEASGVVSPTIDIKANTNGIVVEKRVNEEDYVSQWSVLFNVSNLSQVWVMFDAYEIDLPFLKVGDKLEFTVQAIPEKVFSGKISFINPIIDKTTRTAKVRVAIPNANLALKPEMYASAKIKATLTEHLNQIIIPKSAILWTGKRSIVYVKQPDINAAAFLLREVTLGPSLGNSYVILSGLSEGEEVVTNGAFVIDASAQLEGKRSMMNDQAGTSSTGSHAHHGAEAKTDSKDTKHAMLGVKGACEMCKDRIEKAAKSVDGVLSAHYDLKGQELHLDFNQSKTDLDKISKAIAAVGHDTDKDKADEVTYNALPGCCHYR